MRKAPFAARLCAILAMAIAAGADPATELRLSAEPPAGGWADPVEGARWEEMKRRAGEELSGRPVRGPLRCRLRAIPGAAAAKEPELEVVLDNPSDATVVLRNSAHPLDYVTFIFRGPGGEVASSFCYADVRSPLVSQPSQALTFDPGQARAAAIYLSVAANHGYRPLPSGRYSIEAVLDGGGRELLARSDRLPVFVGRP